MKKIENVVVISQSDYDEYLILKENLRIQSEMKLNNIEEYAKSKVVEALELASKKAEITYNHSSGIKTAEIWKPSILKVIDDIKF